MQLPQVLAPIEAMLGGGFWLSSFTASLLSSNSTHGSLHVDVPNPMLPTPRPQWAVSANAVIPLQDYKVDNGATRAIPGSHRTELVRLPLRNESYWQQTVSFEAPVGSVLFINGAVWHGAGSNVVNTERAALLIFFNRIFIRPQVLPHAHASPIR